MTHKEWLDNEYQQWVKALQESTVYNFKEHPVVKRMLGEPDVGVWERELKKQRTLTPEQWVRLEKIHTLSVGDAIKNRGLSYRYIYYALEILKRNPASICEIGGGVGQFYAILRALGYKGSYCIMDLTIIQEFQIKYLAEVEMQTGLRLDLVRNSPEMILSFYSFGEFDDKAKKEYWGLINNVQNGYIAWNPHSGATDDISLFRHDIKVTPGIEPGIKIIEW